jgi:membrane protein DedA with SNARE-associated domain
MSDMDLTNWFLIALTNYGALLLGCLLFLGALGLPLPGTLFLLATGALAQQGKIDWAAAAGISLVGVVLGDSIGYMMGRSGSQLFHKRGANWQKAEAYFVRHGGTAVYLTRFLFTPFAVPTNIVAGGSNFTFSRFLRYDIVGELTWIVVYGGLGYFVGEQWELIRHNITTYSNWVMLSLLLAFGLYSGLRFYMQTHKTTLMPTA